ncbi:lipopolysaccharide biosynthesis protein [Psychrobacter phenylpyruvicus]|uniref:Polysaccharide biosynthesis protein n=1 Tax=Psychrobacter phenylpyruvicus TaxID=29432 RepID=A0A379LPR1_9GAMM|nr:oligosaccharide flippase family protein [Psychrobacter phenylpyruvicus]SUD91792.1 Polysaccharide biosynthesis protein [Psychrobacter phenylpyruvicus]
MKKPKASGFIGGTSIYLLSNILNGIIPFILLPVLTRYLSPSEYGEVAMFQTLLGALGAFTGSVFVGAAGRKYYDSNLNREELAEFIGSCIQLISIFSTLVFIVLFIFQNQFSEWLSLKTSYIIFAVITAACSAIVSIRLGQWQVQKLALKFGIFQISQSLLNMLLSLLLVVVMFKGAEGRINAQIITTLIFSLTSLLLLNKDHLLKVFVWRKDYIREALKFGVPLIPHIAGGFLLTTVDRFVINREIGLAEAGIYMVAIQLTAAINIVFDAINKAYVPWLFEKLKEDNQQQKIKIVKFTYAWFALILIGACLSFYIGPYIVVFIAGEQYSKAGEVIGWLALGQGFQGMYLMVTNYIFYSKRTGLLSIASLSSGLLNIVLLFILIRLLDLEGASIAFAISMGIRFLLTWYIAHKRFSMPWFNFHLKV